MIPINKDIAVLITIRYISVENKVTRVYSTVNCYVVDYKNVREITVLITMSPDFIVPSIVMSLITTITEISVLITMSPEFTAIYSQL